jgi:DNA polymerase III epsilon subunit-like protein
VADWRHARFAVVDVEGNGQRPPNVVELAVVPIDDGVIGQPTSWLVRPPLPITGIARGVHGITNGAIADRPAIADLDAEIRTALDGRVIVAHNAHVDVAVLTRELLNWEPAGVIDTLALSRQLLQGIVASFRLGQIADALGLTAGLPKGLAPHRAEYDALVCARLFLRLAGTNDGAAAINAALAIEQIVDERLF